MSNFAPSFFASSEVIVLLPPGQSATVSAGTVVAGTSQPVLLVGSQASISQGWTSTIVGASLTSAMGVVPPSTTLFPPGQQLTSLQSGVIPPLYGQQVVTSQGSVADAPSVPLLGQVATTLQGYVEAFLGQQATVIQNSVINTPSVGIAGVEGDTSSGTITTAVDMPLSGMLIQVQGGGFSLPEQFPLNGSVAFTAQGAVSPEIDVIVPLAGSLANSQAGSFVVFNAGVVSGSSASFSAGNLYTIAAQSATTTSGVLAPALSEAISQPTVLTVGIGSLAHTDAVSLTGVAGTTTSGTVQAPFTVALTGLQVAVSAGLVHDILGQVLTTQQGSLVTVPTEAITGLAVTTAIGNITAADAVSVGVQPSQLPMPPIQAQSGSVKAPNSVGLSGAFITTSIGNITAGHGGVVAITGVVATTHQGSMSSSAPAIASLAGEASSTIPGSIGNMHVLATVGVFGSLLGGILSEATTVPIPNTRGSTSGKGANSGLMLISAAKIRRRSPVTAGYIEASDIYTAGAEEEDIYVPQIPQSTGTP